MNGRIEDLYLYFNENHGERICKCHVAEGTTYGPYLLTRSDIAQAGIANWDACQCPSSMVVFCGDVNLDT